MSGGGGGFDRPPGGQVDCADIREQTNLNSVDAAVAATVTKNDVLTVRAQTRKGPLVALTDKGSIVGSITSASLARILECIAEGHKYVAQVQSVQGGQVSVLVRHQ
jgi:CTP-dependent riboflavin kinase